MTTETVTISKFKATCLRLLKQVKKKGEPILVTAERGTGGHGSAATPCGKIRGMDGGV